MLLNTFTVKQIQQLDTIPRYLIERIGATTYQVSNNTDGWTRIKRESF
jgi:hypothetical protein